MRTEFKEKFLIAINDDLNMPRALAVVQELLKSRANSSDKLATVVDFDRALGLNLHQVGKSEELPPALQKLMQDRQKARKAKDWGVSDRLRDEIQSMGYVVHDTKTGMKIFKK